MATASVCLPLRGIFDIEKGHFDVTLTEDTLVWSPIGPKHDSPSDDTRRLNLKDVYAVKIKRRVRANSQGGYPLGFTLFHRKIDADTGQIKPATLTVTCSEEQLCQEWMRTIRQIVEDFPERPKQLNIILDSASNKDDSIYRRKVEILLQYAQITLKESGDSNNKVTDVLQEMDLTNSDGILCVGSDNLINQVINGLLIRAQKDGGINHSTYFTPVRCMLPIGIISTGPLDLLSYSVHGTNNPVTAALHVMFGDIQPVDVCSIYQDGRFQQFGFTAMYGFHSDSICTANKKPWLGLFRSIYAKAKSLVNIQPYECNIEYLPVDEISDRQRCHLRCDKCVMVEEYRVLSQHRFTAIQENNEHPMSSVVSPRPISAVTNQLLAPHIIEVRRSRTPDPPKHSKMAWLEIPTDVIRTRSNPELLRNGQTRNKKEAPYMPHLNLEGIAVNPSDTGIYEDDLSSENWKSVSETFLDVGILSLPGLCSLVPQYGLSPSTHLADGTASLILIQNTSKTNFLQHLRRYGTSKDPFDFPFTKATKVKAVRVSCPSVTNDGSHSSLLEETSSYDMTASSQWTVDGQVTHGYNLEIRVHHQILAVFGGTRETQN
ncbi:ceramide kinase-like protein isoform X2 [Glandiceps talaboti]